MIEQKKQTPLYVKFAMAVISILLFVLLAETALRIVDPELGYKNQFFPVNRDIDFPEFYEKDSKLFWKLRANETLESRWFSELSYHINSSGLRGKEIRNEKLGLRVLALGNSCTFGWGVYFDKCWTTLLEERLRTATGENVEVINAGIPGYSSHQGKIMFEKMLSYQPDVVVIMFGWNDHWRAGKDISDAEQAPPPGIVISLQNSLSKLRIYKLVRKITLIVTEDTTFVRMDDTSGKRRVSTNEFYDNLNSIIQSARSNSVKPILLVPPIASLENYNLGTISSLHVLHHRYQKEVIRVAQYLKAPVIDLQKVFDRHNDLFDDPFGDPIHFNVKGHKVVEEAITPVLISVTENSPEPIIE